MSGKYKPAQLVRVIFCPAKYYVRRVFSFSYFCGVGSFKLYGTDFCSFTPQVSSYYSDAIGEVAVVFVGAPSFGYFRFVFNYSYHSAYPVCSLDVVLTSLFLFVGKRVFVQGGLAKPVARCFCLSEQRLKTPFSGMFCSVIKCLQPPSRSTFFLFAFTANTTRAKWRMRCKTGLRLLNSRVPSTLNTLELLATGSEMLLKERTMFFTWAPAPSGTSTS